MNEVAVMGDLASIIAFRSLGFHVVPVTEGMDVKKSLSALIAEERFAVIYLTEDIAQACEAILHEMKDQYLPALIPIPQAFGSTDYGLHNVEASIRKAVGFDVLSVIEAHTEQEDLDLEDV